MHPYRAPLLSLQLLTLLALQTTALAIRNKRDKDPVTIAEVGTNILTKAGDPDRADFVFALAQHGLAVSSSNSSRPRATEFLKVFSETFILMLSVETFDRTWFMTLVCSLKHGWGVAFLGSVLALTVHALMAVLFGAVGVGLLPKLVLELVTAVLFGSFALMYAWSACQAEQNEDHLNSCRAEVGEADEVDSATSASRTGGPARAVIWEPLLAVFLAIFIAEWGDRTQLVIIGLSASFPAVPVLLGAFVALIILCLSAVLLARALEGMHVNMRLVNVLCSISFGVMASLSLAAAVREALKHGD